MSRGDGSVGVRSFLQNGVGPKNTVTTLDLGPWRCLSLPLKCLLENIAIEARQRGRS